MNNRFLEITKIKDDSQFYLSIKFKRYFYIVLALMATLNTIFYFDISIIFSGISALLVIKFVADAIFDDDRSITISWKKSSEDC